MNNKVSDQSGHGPPGEVCPAGSSLRPGPTLDNYKPATVKDQQAQHSAASQHRRHTSLGARARGFREGFDRGALDALRMMSRRCRCLDCAAEVEKLAEYYTSAADRRAS